ncbi:MAG: hypothetical protein HY064_14670 [Bacteroidetes bacterium]|nr:hypothetical protein [Bacteroidota bacterium]
MKNGLLADAQKIVYCKLHLVNIAAGIFLFTVPLFSQSKNPSDTLSPLRVVQKYVSGERWDDKFKYFCCEMQGEWKTDSTLGMVLPSRVKRDCSLLFEDTGHAVVDAWLHDSATSQNYYFFLFKGQVWTVFAIRTLQGVDEIEKQCRDMDTMTVAEQKKFISPNGFSWQFEYDNLSLWTSSDSVLSRNFHSCEKDFIAIQNLLVKNKLYGKNDSLVNTAMMNKKIKKKANALLIRDISVSKKYPGAVFYMIGGAKDNSIGYMYQPDPKKIPHMTEKHFILMKSLGDGWYLFKTT